MYVLPGFHSFLTNVEDLRVAGSDKANNIDQVDQLVEILLTKEKMDFKNFWWPCGNRVMLIRLHYMQAYIHRYAQGSQCLQRWT